MKVKYRLIYRVSFSCVSFRNKFVMMIMQFNIKLLKGFSNGPLLAYLSKDIILLIGPYLCLLYKICRANTDCWLFCFIYLMCSWYLCFRR